MALSYALDLKEIMIYEHDEIARYTSFIFMSFFGFFFVFVF